MAHASPNPAGTTVDEYPAHAGFHAGFHAGVSTSAFGAAVVRVRVLGPDLGPFPSMPNEDIERAIDRFAATVPTEYRLRALLNANPLHLHRTGEITD
jgi:hypothetical protein